MPKLFYKSSTNSKEFWARFFTTNPSFFDISVWFLNLIGWLLVLLPYNLDVYIFYEVNFSNWRINMYICVPFWHRYFLNYNVTISLQFMGDVTELFYFLTISNLLVCRFFWFGNDNLMIRKSFSESWITTRLNNVFGKFLSFIRNISEILLQCIELAWNNVSQNYFRMLYDSWVQMSPVASFSALFSSFN